MEEINRRLYACDNLAVLRDEIAFPSDSVDLIYLDPPFNSNSTYNLPFKRLGKDVAAVAAFEDTWTWGQEEDEHLAYLDAGPSTRLLGDIVRVARQIDGPRSKVNLGAYLVNMAVRLIPMKRILKSTGSIYLHCDPTASHYLKVLMDTIFGNDNFRNEIIWRIGWVSGFKTQKRGWIRNHDTILYYVASSSAVRLFNKEYLPYPEGYVRRDGKPPTGKGFPIEDTWNCSPGDVLDSIMIKSFSREKLGYPTQKNLDLLERIVRASSNPGDLVLDPFCGCGTTMHAAEKLGRRWTGIDISRFSAGLVRERLLSNIPTLDSHDVQVIGLPTMISEARILAANDKFEFEKWVCGAIGAHGMYHNPGDKGADGGADGGVDGVIEFYPFRMGRKPEREYAIVQVKGGNVTADAVRALYAVVKQTGATAGIMVCFADQMRTVENNCIRELYSDDAGDYPVIQGYSIEDLLAHQPLNLPLHRLRDDARLVP